MFRVLPFGFKVEEYKKGKNLKREEPKWFFLEARRGSEYFVFSPVGFKGNLSLLLLEICLFLSRGLKQMEGLEPPKWLRSSSCWASLGSFLADLLDWCLQASRDLAELGFLCKNQKKREDPKKKTGPEFVKLD